MLQAQAIPAAAGRERTHARLRCVATLQVLETAWATCAQQAPPAAPPPMTQTLFLLPASAGGLLWLAPMRQDGMSCSQGDPLTAVDAWASGGAIAAVI